MKIRRRPGERVSERRQIGVRPPAALYEALQAAALANDRSLGAECEDRLTASFAPQTDLRALIREELRSELRAELRSEIRLAMAEYVVEGDEMDGDEARH